MSRFPQQPSGSAQPGAATFHPGRVLLPLVLAIAAAALPAQADPVGRLLYADATRYLTAADPIVRGEAALVVAAAQDPHSYDALLAVAKDPDPQAELRGILALGYLGEPSAQALFEVLLDESAARARPRGIAAAFALGLLPEGPTHAAVTRQLIHFLEANMKRQREMVLALLTALVTRGARAELAALQRLADDDALRDPQVRAALILALARIPDALDTRLQMRTLASGSADERRALLSAVAAGTLPANADAIKEFERLAARDADAEVRAAALTALTRLRHLPALELGARAIRSSHPAEIEQGTRTALLLGGAPLRRAIECQLEALTPSGKTALLAGWFGPMSEGFADDCLELARSRSSPVDLRYAAAMAIARAGSAPALGLLRELFATTDELPRLRELARALVPANDAPPSLADLCGSERLADLALATDRLCALLLAEHPEASRFCVDQLQRKDLPLPAAASVLRAIRLARLGQPPTDVLPLVPEPVRAVLQ